MDNFDELLLRLVRTSEPYARDKILKALYKLNSNELKKDLYTQKDTKETQSFYDETFIQPKNNESKPRIDVMSALREIKNLTINKN